MTWMWSESNLTSFISANVPICYSTLLINFKCENYDGIKLEVHLFHGHKNAYFLVFQQRKRLLLSRKLWRSESNAIKLSHVGYTFVMTWSYLQQHQLWGRIWMTVSTHVITLEMIAKQLAYSKGEFAKKVLPNLCFITYE